MAKSYLITLQEEDLQTLIFSCVDRAIKLNKFSIESEKKTYETGNKSVSNFNEKNFKKVDQEVSHGA